jgi:hypothetical protein
MCIFDVVSILYRDICDFSRVWLSFGYIAPNTLNHLAFQSFDFERSW